MLPTTSIFLDLMRFSAAVVVLLHHLTATEINSVLPRVPIGHEAVTVFFVMSGFVIAYVLHSRENSLEQYTAARLGRLYSVVLPALALTWVLDGWGRAASPELYAGSPHDHALLRLLVNSLFLQQNWNLTVMPLSNGPFWSLGFEFWYYVIFGGWVLLRGRARVAVVSLACLAAGPRILAAFPVWLLGALAFRLSQTWVPPRRLASSLFVLSSLAFLTMLVFGNPLGPLREAVRRSLQEGYFDFGFARVFAGDIPRVPEDLLLGAAFAVMVMTVSLVWGNRPVPQRLVTLIRYLAGSTFSVYLFHLPLLHFLVAVLHVDKYAAVELMTVGALVLACCILLSYAGERHVMRYRSALLSLFAWLKPGARVATGKGGQEVG